MEEKHFEEWLGVKEALHFTKIFREVKEGDVWWCSIGENVGIEINGKQELFLRPVLVLRKLSKFGFMGIPLTSKFHDGIWYVEFEFKNRKQYAALAQARVFSIYRLCRKMGSMSDSDLELVKDGFKKLYF